MLDQFAPGERDAMRQPLTDLVGELQRLGVLGKLDLNNLSAYNLRVEGLQLDAQTRRADLAFVRITGGTANYSFSSADLPLGSFLLSLLGSSATESSTSTGRAELATGDDGVVTIKRAGRWYISIGYTIAEQARLQAGASLDDLGERVTAKGADTPENAVRQLLQAAAKLDLRGVIELLPPGEMGALQEYAGLFLPDAQKAISADAPKITIDALDLTSKIDGSTATVTIDEVAGTATYDATTVTLRGGCIVVKTSGVTSLNSCDAPKASALPDLGALQSIAGAKAGIRVVKVDGKWYVSPVRTALDSFVAALAAIEPGDLLSMVDSIQGLTQSLGGSYSMSSACDGSSPCISSIPSCPPLLCTELSGPPQLIPSGLTATTIRG
jgi:hypothetical protein